MSGIYFSLVGAVPLAVANSFSWFVKLQPTTFIEQLFFIISDTEEAKTDHNRKIIPEICSVIEDNLQHFESLKAIETDIEKEKVITIPEPDLLKSSKIIFDEILKRKNNSKQLFIDVTGGRKTMTGAAIIASIYLQNHFYSLNQSISTKLVYYWVKRYIKANLKKRAYKLGRDEIEVKIFDVDSLQKIFESGKKP
ncbi:MAG: hypothetical protein GF308_19975 [Candidatus Heimdallarchaeota archaeon]|nr:hypothetical protein [Candidatus Heimdallarchaeota archaeon]